MLVNALNSTYSMNAYRELMRSVKREEDTMQVYRDHLIEMNRAFAEEDLGLEVQDSEEGGEDQDYLFELALKGHAHQYSQLEQLFEFPVFSELQIKCESDTNTEKTMKSDMEWNQRAFKDSLKISGMGTAKL